MTGIRTTVPTLPKGMQVGTKGCASCGVRGVRLTFTRIGQLLSDWLCASCKATVTK